MNSKSATPIPGAIEQLQRQLDEFRSTRPHRTKLPETLWQAAVELARQHGVYSVAHPLRLDYTGLKKRLDGVPDRKEKAAKPAFVELIADHSAKMADGVIEFESSVGSKIRIQWKASTAPDWISLLRAWRESER
ncbi:MAG: hypothetical protein WBE76_13820 [Terracidiphilus sp.]